MSASAIGGPLSTIEVSGACSTPYCPVFDDAGACGKYQVYLTQAGTCHITGFTADGRQASADVAVMVAGRAGCCGTPLRAEHDVILEFPVSSTLDGAAGG
jgi:hypothetical protein